MVEATQLEGVTERVAPLCEEQVRESAHVRWLAGGTSTRATWLGLALSSLLLVFAAGQIFADVAAQNEGELLAYPWLMLQGYVPYRDIWMMFPPGTFVLLAALTKVGISPLVAERGLAFVAKLSYVVLVNRAFTHSWTRVSPIGVLIPFSLLFLAAEGQAAPAIVGAPVLLLALLAARDRVYLSAALFVVAALFRFEFGIVGMACLVALAALRWWNAESWRREALAAVFLAGGLAAVYGGLDLLTAGQAVRQIVVLPELVVYPDRAVPLFPPQFGPIGVPIELAVLILPGTVFLLALRRRLTYLAATNLALCCALPQLLQHPNWTQLCTVGAEVLPWSVLGLVSLLTGSTDRVGPGSPARIDLVSQRVPEAAASTRGSDPPVSARPTPQDMRDDTGGASPTKRSPVNHHRRAGGYAKGRHSRTVRWTARFALISTGIWPAMLMIAWFLYVSSFSPLSHFRGWDHVVSVGGRSVIVRDAGQARAYAQVSRYLVRRAGPSDRLFISDGSLRTSISNPVFLYYLTGMHPASSHLEMNPGIEDQAQVQREIVRSLHPGTWIVEWTAGTGADAGTAGRPGSQIFERWTAFHARPVLENSDYRVLRVA